MTYIELLSVGLPSKSSSCSKLVLPILASACSLKIHENQIAKGLVKLLPKVKKVAWEEIIPTMTQN